jgi:hypothetical protein
MSTLTKAALAALLCLAGVSALPAQNSDYGVPSDDWGYSDPDIRQTVARVGYISGDVSFARGDDPDDWQPADSNVPMTLGDRVWTSGGKLELEVHGGSVIRLANSTDLTALNLTEDTKQFSMSAGVASFRVPRLADDEVYEVDTPNAAVTFEQTGDYRIDVRPNGDTRVQVRSGRAVVASAGGQVPLRSGAAMVIEGSEPPRYDMVGMPHPDGWDGWVRDRDARYANVQSYNYVSPDIAGAQDLDQYGRWQQVPSYGWAWTPTRVAVGWQPYRVGRWIWQDPWGWTWVSTEPWGWAPYHYGRWVTVSSNWYWIPVAPRVPVVAYSPALVAFVGGGPGFSVSVGVGTNYVGWFPLAPRDPLVPWWGRPPATVVNVTNVTYVNQTYVTVVNQNTFVSSQVVNTNVVRDQQVIQRIERAPVVRGQVPVAPTRQSIRMATVSQTRAAVRPPANIAQRSVVSRVAPPPAPPRFDTKVATIQEQKRPVTTVEAERIVQRTGRAAPAQAVRPAAEQSGRVALQPKTSNTTQPKAEPIAAPSRGRQLATKEQPVAPLSDRPAAASQRGRPAAAPAPDRDARQPSQQETQQQREQTDRDQAARDQRDKALQQDRAQQEQNQREQADRLQQQREQAQRDQQQREQVQRDQRDKQQQDQRDKQQQDQRDKQQQDQQENQQAQRDRARQQQLERQEAQRQQDQREQLERQQAKQDDARRDQLEQQQREQQERQKAQREQAQRQQQQQERQQVQRQQAPRPTARPAPDEPQRSDARESKANPNSNRPQPEQAQSDRDNKDKEKPANTPQRGRRPTPKPTPDKNG